MRRRDDGVPLAAAAVFGCGSPDTPPRSWEESSVSTLEASSAQESGRRPHRYTGRASGPSLSNAEDLSEQRGWTPTALASPSEPSAAPAAGHIHTRATEP